MDVAAMGWIALRLAEHAEGIGTLTARPQKLDR
jgi:hypothetical protein